MLLNRLLKYLIIRAEVLRRELEESSTNQNLEVRNESTWYNSHEQLTGMEWCLAARANWCAPFSAFSLSTQHHRAYCHNDKRATLTLHQPWLCECLLWPVKGISIGCYCCIISVTIHLVTKYPSTKLCLYACAVQQLTVDCSVQGLN